ncbi:DNA cytosine methyltransferase [uncultured Gimesia sp.]|mgnify:CR=1 FL=1|uniref:DNA cytosine methyltransferase n=1 Tax=uncultured Gimesia sp. TaxID=1678688 RepID=UPI0030D8FA5E|tara:strand:+ start:74778 stop:75797 length:1020 start_codon:yes stop_codon:yes gene_type:complete
MKAIDFFCGAGGLTHGLLNAGIEVVGGFDIDEECRETYEHNNAASFHSIDIRDVSLKELKSRSRLRKFDNVLFAGCAPCQPFSQQRKSETVHHSTTLLTAFGRLIEEALPRAVVIENVPGMARVKGFSTFRRFLHMLEKNGYGYVYDVLDAKKFGVPQNRRRLVLIAIRSKEVSIPINTHGRDLQPFRTVRDAISHFPEVAAGKTHPKVPNHSTANISEINLQRLQYTPLNGGDRRTWPKRLQLDCHKNGYEGHTDVYGRMFWDLPAPTLTARCYSISNGRYGHPEQDRAISLREAAALQSFPDNYQFFGSNTHIAQQIGNAVPVRFAAALGMHIKDLT